VRVNSTDRVCRVFPTRCGGPESSFVVRPIVKRAGIEVSAGRPHERMYLGINTHLTKELRIAQRAEEFAFQNGLEIDAAGGPVPELDFQFVGSDLPEGLDAMNGMVHGFSLLQRGNRRRPAAGPEQFPVGEQFLLV
jgi:hypothetical protein